MLVLPSSPRRRSIRGSINKKKIPYDLSAQDLAGVLIKAVDEWLDEEIIGFEPGEG